MRNSLLLCASLLLVGCVEQQTVQKRHTTNVQSKKELPRLHGHETRQHRWQAASPYRHVSKPSNTQPRAPWPSIRDLNGTHVLGGRFKPGLAAERPQANSQVAGLRPVLFATNRQIKRAETFELASITTQRTSDLTFGLAMVSIPKAHRIGRTERPSSYLVFFTEEETDTKHFVIKQLTRLTRDEFSSKIGGDLDSIMIFVHGLACTRFRRHRVWCFDGTGGASWRGGSLRGSSSLRLCA